MSVSARYRDPIFLRSLNQRLLDRLNEVPFTWQPPPWLVVDGFRIIDDGSNDSRCTTCGSRFAFDDDNH